MTFKQQDIRDLVLHSPFQAFRLHLADGKQLSVPHPDFALPGNSLLVVANEFFDALPVRHYVKTLAGWRQRLVGLDQTGALAFGLSESIETAITAPAREGSIIEVCPTGQRLMSDIAQRLVREGGILLLIDYGYTQTSLGDSLQAVSRHNYVDPLNAPGEADLTAHVDFGALARAARTTRRM